MSNFRRQIGDGTLHNYNCSLNTQIIDVSQYNCLNDKQMVFPSDMGIINIKAPRKKLQAYANSQEQFQSLLIILQNSTIQLLTFGMSSDDQNVLTHTKKLGNSQFSVYCKSLPETAHLIYNIQKYLTRHQSFYLNYILIINKGRTVQTLVKRLQKQYEDLINQKSFLHLITKALSSREKCIQKIKRELSKATSVLKIFKKVYFKHGNKNDSAYLDYVHQDGYTAVQVDQSIQNSIRLINQIFVNMARLRDMTIYIIETVHRWKQQVQEWSDKCNQYKQIFFMNNKRNIYQTILKDTSFIWQSQLSGYIWMQFKNDPFLIRNVLQVQQKQQKLVLEKYFIEILYPKQDQIVSKALKCFEFLSFKYQPKIQNLYAQQEELIQSYLKIQKKQHEQSGIKFNTKAIYGNNSKILQWEDKADQNKINSVSKLHPKGWVFGSYLQRPARQRVQSIIDKHQHRMTIIKPFNISNFAERKTLALAFIDNLKSQKNYNSKSNRQIQIIKTNESKRIGRGGSSEQSDNQKGYKSQNDIHKMSSSKSLNKFNQVIIEDPRQYQPETPKKKIKQVKQPATLLKKQNLLATLAVPQNNISTTSQTQSLSKPKLNTFFNSQNKPKNYVSQEGRVSIQIKNKSVKSHIDYKQNFKTAQSTKIQHNNSLTHQNSSQQKIDVQNQETPLNFSQFLTTFRADTNKKMYNSQDQDAKKSKIKQNQKKLSHVRQLIIAHRRKGGKSLVSLRRKTFSKQKLINGQLALNLSPYVKNSFSNKKKQKTKNNSSILSQRAINEYEQINLNKSKNLDALPIPSEQSLKKFQIDQFIILKPKTIPIDTLPKYMRHIFSQEHSTSKKFTLYSLQSILKKISDPCTHCLIFDIFTQTRGHIGQAILIQSFGASQKLKYTLEFINIQIFQLIVVSILRIAQQLLSTTPCDQVICPFYIDKLDHVSIHFVSLIEQSFKEKVKPFGQVNIYEKKGVYFQGSDVHQRLYIFSSRQKKTEAQITKRIMGNYRSLKFQCKCLVLTSNFRLRGKTVAKDVISNYYQTSIGNLYRRIFSRILTKYHLRQIRTATLSTSEQDQTVNIVKQNAFLRSLIQSLSSHIKQNKQEKIQITKFQTMAQVLSYIDYKGYSKQFYFAPFHQSRFILNHQLYLSQLQIQLSLQFMIKMSVDFMILYNNRDLMIQKVGVHNQCQAYLLPTTENDIKLLLMKGKQYQQYSQTLDLFSYLLMFVNQYKNDIVQLNNVKEIVIPNIKKSRIFLSGVKMFDGFFRLFPQRQFYSGSYLKMSNLWQSYFPSAIIEKPSQNAIILQHPLIIGFYKESTKQILSAFLINE